MLWRVHYVIHHTFERHRSSKNRYGKGRTIKFLRGGWGLGNFFVHAFFSSQLNTLDHISLHDFFFHTHICPYKQLARFFLICLFVHDIFSPYFFSARIFFWYLPNPPPQKLNGPSLKPLGKMCVINYAHVLSM